MDYLFFAVELFFKTLILYLAVMNLKRFKGTYTLDQKCMFYPIVFIGYCFNVFFRYTVGFLLKIPTLEKDDLMFTSVLDTYVNEDSVKGTICKYLCKILDKFDPSGDHCKYKEK